MVTDPPYGVGFERGKFVAGGKGRQRGGTFAPMQMMICEVEGLTKFYCSGKSGLWAGDRANDLYVVRRCLKGHFLNGGD